MIALFDWMKQWGTKTISNRLFWNTMVDSLMCMHTLHMSANNACVCEVDVDLVRCLIELLKKINRALSRLSKIKKLPDKITQQHIMELYTTVTDIGFMLKNTLNSQSPFHKVCFAYAEFNRPAFVLLQRLQPVLVNSHFKLVIFERGTFETPFIM